MSKLCSDRIIEAADVNDSSPVVDTSNDGDIHGALGTIRRDDFGFSSSLRRRITTLLAILGPGIIVMVGDNDAGAFATYAQAGQNYGTELLWTLLLLVPVLYVNQEMVLRLGAVTGVGHAKLVFERFGKFWGAFSVVDLFALNALTIITEFIGISLALDYLGLPKYGGVMVAALLTILAAGTGNFRRFERFALFLCLGSFLLLPIMLVAHVPAKQIVYDLVLPGIPDGELSDIMLLVIGIVGTTVAPWQLFFQQSYIIDKRITSRFIDYERIDLCIGIGLAIAAAISIVVFSAAIFTGRPEAGNFTDSKGIAVALGQYADPIFGKLFAIALLDASVIGAAAVSLSTAYAIGDTLSLNHSLHNRAKDAKIFYSIYYGLILISAGLVLLPGAPLGLITEAVQSLAGVLLPSTTVFLLLLCNDKSVLGPWVNGWKMNLFTGVIIAVLVLLSLVLTVSVLYPGISSSHIFLILGGGAVVGFFGFVLTMLLSRSAAVDVEATTHLAEQPDIYGWRMTSIALLPPACFSAAQRLWMGGLRLYLVLAVGMVIVRVIQLGWS